MKHYFITFGKSLIVGSTMLVPGVSGGSMAMILGIYTKLIHAVSSFMKDKLHSAFFLSVFLAGSLLGIVSFSKPILHLIETYPMPMLYFFMGAVAGSVPLMLRQAKITYFSWTTPVYIVLGFLIVFFFETTPISTVTADEGADWYTYLMLVIAGFIAAIALVLPGISVSYMLLLLGLYDETMRAASEFYLPFLLPLGFGLVAGILLTTKLLEKLMNEHPRPTFLVILGFILGSLLELYPGIPAGSEIIICMIALVLGFGIIKYISSKDN
ncbi:DUF368 domain-containing protein [Megamonas hypermegale]|uniref:DUF368 domain-containing protein n=1 Tax=Megamonas hypermegale TaxID=158847 RepID=UPI0026EE8521|nr:DUF368 domain-containing protein [Megamonas hypermegale]